MNKKNNRKKILYNSIVPLIGIAVIAVILIVSTVVLNGYADKSAEDSIISLGEFYLNEITTRNVDEVRLCFNEKVYDMKKAISELRVDYLKDEKSLQWYISMVQNINGMDMFAVVDSKGKIYAADETLQDEQKFDFLKQDINEITISTITNYNSKAMVMIAMPVEGVSFNGEDIVTCFTGLDIEKIISSIRVQGNENQVYCRLFSKSGDNLLFIKGDYPDGKNLFDVYREKASFAEGYSLNKLKEDWSACKEGYTVYSTSDAGYSYVYYKNVPGTDWMLTALMRQSMINTQISDVNNDMFRVSIIQLIIVVCAMGVVFMLATKIVLQSRHARHEREKEELMKQEQIAVKEKLEMQTKLLAEEKLAHRHDAILNILSRDYTSVYYVDIIKNKAIPYRVSGVMFELMGIEVEKPFVFETVFCNYVNSFVVEEDREEMLSYCDAVVLDELLKENGMFSHIYRVNRDGQIIYAQLRIAKVREERKLKHIILGFAIVDREVREEQEKTRALRDALVQAEHASRVKTTFLSNMSHDIRTPMNAIVGYTALATTHIEDNKRVLAYLKKIQTSSNHLLNLINDILDMSRIESGKVNIEEKECSLAEMMQDIKNIVQTDVLAKQLEFYIDTLGVIHENVYCDRLRLNRVLLNCISNAIKYTGACGTISVRIIEKKAMDSEHGIYEFRVKDNGIGMTEEFQKHIFEPFERERTSTASGIQGTGLGMAITKNIVDMMDGTIEVESKEGVGSEFIITLTLKTAGDSSVTSIPELVGSHALVVDDDFNTCQSVSTMLISIGIRSEWTMSGKEAVLKARYATEQNDSYGVYIIDWLMPDMNGIEVVRRIRGVIGDEIPIIILTAYDWSDIEQEAREAGVTSFCSKPLFMSELREVLFRSAVGVEAAASDEIIENNYEEDDDALSLKDINVLLVEDNELNREIVYEVLSEAGMNVDMAENGKMAVDKINVAPAGTYDIVLMDIQMPVMDGYEATRNIRNLEEHQKADIPIVAMTANAFEEDRQHAFEVGMNAHIAKPVDISLLFAVIKEKCKK